MTRYSKRATAIEPAAHLTTEASRAEAACDRLLDCLAIERNLAEAAQRRFDDGCVDELIYASFDALSEWEVGR